MITFILILIFLSPVAFLPLLIDGFLPTHELIEMGIQLEYSE